MKFAIVPNRCSEPRKILSSRLTEPSKRTNSRGTNEQSKTYSKTSSQHDEPGRSPVDYVCGSVTKPRELDQYDAREDAELLAVLNCISKASKMTYSDAGANGS